MANLVNTTINGVLNTNLNTLSTVNMQVSDIIYADNINTSTVNVGNWVLSNGEWSASTGETIIKLDDDNTNTSVKIYFTDGSEGIIVDSSIVKFNRSCRSSIADGTAPISCNTTNLCTNLNAEFLQGHPLSDFNTYVNVTEKPSVTVSLSGVASGSGTSTNFGNMVIDVDDLASPQFTTLWSGSSSAVSNLSISSDYSAIILVGSTTSVQSIIFRNPNMTQFNIQGTPVLSSIYWYWADCYWDGSAYDIYLRYKNITSTTSGNSTITKVIGVRYL
jgi:hypothetical protein